MRSPRSCILAPFLFLASMPVSMAQSQYCGRNSVYDVLKSFSVECTLESVDHELGGKPVVTAVELVQVLRKHNVDVRIIAVDRTSLAELERFLAQSDKQFAAIIAVPDRRPYAGDGAPYHFAKVDAVSSNGISFSDSFTGDAHLLPTWKMSAEDGEIPVLLCSITPSIVDSFFIILDNPLFPLSITCCLVLSLIARPLSSWLKTFLKRAAEILSTRSKTESFCASCILLVATFSSISFLSYMNDASREPIVYISENTYVGELEIGETTNAVIGVRNLGAEHVEISVREISCHCLRISPALLKLEPGQSGSFEAEIEATKSGLSKQQILLASKIADDTSLFTSHVEYIGIPNRAVLPGAIRVAPFSAGIASSRVLEFYSDTEGIIESIVSVEKSSSGAANERGGEKLKAFEFQIIDTVPSQSGMTIRVRVLYDGSVGMGLFVFTMIFKTGGDSPKSYACKVNGEIEYPARIIPNYATRNNKIDMYVSFSKEAVVYAQNYQLWIEGSRRVVEEIETVSDSLVRYTIANEGFDRNIHAELKNNSGDEMSMPQLLYLSEEASTTQ